MNHFHTHVKTVARQGNVRTWQGDTGLDFSFMAETGCVEAESGIPLGPPRHRSVHTSVTEDGTRGSEYYFKPHMNYLAMVFTSSYLA